MNREIKFRGKDMGGHWAYGLLTKKKIRNSNKLQFAIATKDCSMANTIPIIESTIGEFTGFKDIDGNEIFEGDILKDADGETFAVYYKGCSWLAGLPALVEGIGLYDCNLEDKELEACKVIGNIYDTPELLEGSKTNDHYSRKTQINASIAAL